MTQISSGLTEISICKWHECAGCSSSFQIKSSHSVEMKLQALTGNPVAMGKLRSLLNSSGSMLNIQPLDDHEVIKQVCSLLRSGRLTICGTKTATNETDPKQQAIAKLLTALPNKTQNFNFDGQILRLISIQEWKSLTRNQNYQIIPVAQAKQIIKKLTASAFVSAHEKTPLEQTVELFAEPKIGQITAGLLLLRYVNVNYFRSGSDETALTPSQYAQRLQQEKHWIEIELVGEDGRPIANQNYLIVTANQKQYTGSTDADGLARLDDIPDGNCQVSFPDLDKEAWAMA